MMILIARQALSSVGVALFALMLGQATRVDLAIAQVPATTSPIKGSGAASLIEQLKLTPDQKQKIATLRRNRTIEISKMLTPNQKAKFEAARKSGKNMSETIAALGLKPDQKKKIAEIAKSSAGDIMGMLNSQQKKQVMTYLKQRKGGLE